MIDREALRATITAWYGSTPPELDGPRGLLDAILALEKPTRPVVGENRSTGTRYVRVVPAHGGFSTVTSEAGSTYDVRTDQIRMLEQ